MGRASMLLVAALAASLITAANVGAASPAPGKIVIGSKDFTEQFILGQIYAKALTKAGFDVKTKLNLGSTTITDAALRKGDIDLYPEYTGTMLLYVCKKGYSVGQSATLLKRDRACYAKRGLTLLKPVVFSNGNAIACTKKFASANHIATISDLRRVASKVRYATVAEQITSATGVPLIKKHYGFEPGNVKTYDVGLRYKAVESGDADCVYAFGTDSQIAKDKLVVLKDNKHIWPADHATPVVRTPWLKQQSPLLAKTINKINGLLDDKTMTALNARVDVDHEDAADVAEAWLKSKHLI
jgi:osmoprotectant transport system substrate-binding protein